MLRLVSVVLAALLGLSVPAMALIKVPLAISKLEEDSYRIIDGTVTAIDPDKRVLEVKVNQLLAGSEIGEAVRIQLDKPDGLIGRISPKQRVLVFMTRALGGRFAAVHIADQWLTATTVSPKPLLVRTTGEHQELVRGFPGRTTALLRLLEDLKAGKKSILDAAEDRILTAAPQKLAKLDVQAPRHLLSLDANGDRKPDLVVLTAGGARLFINDNGAFADATAAWGLSEAKGVQGAVGDLNGDGKPDLLIGNTLYANQGGKYAPAGMIELPAKVVTVAIADVDGDGKGDAACLDAQRRVSAWLNPGTPDKRWPASDLGLLGPADAPAPAAAAFGLFGEDDRLHLLVARADGVVRYPVVKDAVVDDFMRLAGERWGRYDPANAGLAGAVSLVIDVNGDGRKDWFVVAPQAGILMINRGFGAFFPTNVPVQALRSQPDKPLPFAFSPATPWAVADLAGDGHEEPLILSEDGTLWSLPNPVAP